MRNALEFNVSMEAGKRANRIIRGMDRDLRKTLSVRFRALQNDQDEVDESSQKSI